MSRNWHRAKADGERRAPTELRALWLALVAACGTVGACDEEGIRVYRAPKAPAKATAPEAPAGAQVAWTVPTGWERVPGEQPMRVATFRPAGGLPEVSVSAF